MPYTDKAKQKEASARFYREYKETLKQKFRDRRVTNKKFVQDSKVGKTCADCEIEYPPHIMDFDHVRGKKVCNLSVMHKSYSLDTIKEEIEKCDLVCANCHRHRTWMRSVRTIPCEASGEAVPLSTE